MRLQLIRLTADRSGINNVGRISCKRIRRYPTIKQPPHCPLMKYRDLRDFIDLLEQRGELKRITTEVDPYLEITEICDRTLRAGGPALLFENPKGYDIPLLGNLFGTPERVALGMGEESVEALREVGKLLAFLKEPEPPKGFKDAWEKLPVFKQVLNMGPKVVRKAPCQEVVLEGENVNLDRLPIQTCWPGDAGPLVTWPLVITRGPEKERQNLGIYRMQKIGKNRLIMRWLAHRGGALDFRDWQKAHPGEPFPVSIALGADPATILGAVTPVPDTLSEYGFAGLLRGDKTEVVQSKGNDLQVPASAEFILEGHIAPDDLAEEGPFGDHTGYYNEVDRFPVFTVERITHRKNPIYHSTYTGRPPDEPAVLGVALNEVFVPILRKQFPEIIDFYLPPEGCSYRMADHEEAVPRPRQAGHDGRLVVLAAVYVHQVRDCGGRRCECTGLEGCDLGHHHPHGPQPGHGPGGQHPHRLSRLCLARVRPRLQNGAGCHEQMAR